MALRQKCWNQFLFPPCDWKPLIRQQAMCASVRKHRATHRVLCSNSSPRKAFLSSPNHRALRISLRVILAVPYSENGPQGDPFRNHGGHQMECDGRTAEDSKRSLPPVLPTMAGSVKQVCVCVRARARVLLWRWLGKRCHISNDYIDIPHFRELFDCPSYINYAVERLSDVSPVSHFPLCNL